MSVIVFRLTEAMGRYKVTVGALAAEVGVNPSSVSQWRNGKAVPDLNRLNDIMQAVEKLGDKQALQLFPLSIADVVVWVSDRQIAKQED